MNKKNKNFRLTARRSCLRLANIIILWLLGCSIALAGELGGRKRIGLVLGGGGAKGAAEVGVLKVLEEYGIYPDYIAGTSIGAIVGGLYACGYRAADLEELFRTQEWLSLLGDRNTELRNKVYEERDGTTYIFGFPIGRNPQKTDIEESPLGALTGRKVTQLLDSLTKKYDGIKSFDQLPIPFRCVAVDIRNVEEIIMDSCEIEVAMRASMALPGAFKPVRWKGRLLVDGGMLNNLPVDVVRKMGADIVIAIDLETIQHSAPTYSLKESLGIGGLVDWAVSRPDRKKAKANRDDADIYINPQLFGYDATSFSSESIEDMLERGERAARAMDKQLRKLSRR